VRSKSRSDNEISDANEGTSKIKSVSKDTRKGTTAKAKDVISKKKSSNKENISTGNENKEKTITKSNSNKKKTNKEKKNYEKKTNNEKKRRISEMKGQTGEENTNRKKVISTITLQPMNDSDTSSSDDDDEYVKDKDKIKDKDEGENNEVDDDFVSDRLMKRGRLTPGSVAVENKSTSRYSNSSSTNR
jgi:hypothetical protein